MFENNLTNASSSAPSKSTSDRHKTNSSKSQLRANNATDAGLLSSRTRHHAGTLLLQVIAKCTENISETLQITLGNCEGATRVQHSSIAVWQSPKDKMRGD